MMPKDAPYPAWICGDCAIEYGHRPIKMHLATWHQDTCGICGALVGCTEPRDCGGLKNGWKQARKFWESKGGRR